MQTLILVLVSLDLADRWRLSSEPTMLALDATAKLPVDAAAQTPLHWQSLASAVATVLSIPRFETERNTA